jgi:hypothetical protein
VALLIVAVAAVGAGAMTAYSGSLSLQMLGVRVPALPHRGSQTLAIVRQSLAVAVDQLVGGTLHLEQLTALDTDPTPDTHQVVPGRLRHALVADDRLQLGAASSRPHTSL